MKKDEYWSDLTNSYQWNSLQLNRACKIRSSRPSIRSL